MPLLTLLWVILTPDINPIHAERERERERERFCRVKFFFPKLLKSLFFFQILCDYKGGWVGQTKSGKFQFLTADEPF